MKIIFGVVRPNGTNSDIIVDLANGGIVDVMTSLLNKYVNSLYFSKKYDLIIHSPINDIIKVLICMFLDLGPLGRNDIDDFRKYSKDEGVSLICPLLRILHTSLDASILSDNPSLYQKLFDLKLNVIAALANIPPKLTPILKRMSFDKENDLLLPNNYTPSEAEETETLSTIINDLVDILEYLFENIDNEVGSSSTMLLLFMTSVAKGEQLSREIFLERLYPGVDMAALEDTQFSMNAPEYKNGSVGSILIQNMTASDSVLKYWSTELLFQICNEDGE